MKKIIIKLLILVLIIQFSFNLIDIMYKSSKAVTKIYLNQGESTTITADDSEYNIGDSSIASVSKQTNAKAKQGTTSDYAGNEVNLGSCKYTLIETNNGTYNASHSGGYICLNYNGSNSNVNGSSATSLSIENSNGNFRIYSGENYLGFNSQNKYFTVANNRSNSTTVALYKAVSNGATSSEEIPGYTKVETIVDGETYLIVKEIAGEYYILNPVQRSSTNYDETVKLYKTNEYTITGNQEGTTTLTIGDEEYSIRVYGNTSVREPDDNFIDKAIIISAGTSYTIQTNINSTITWKADDTTIISKPQASGRFNSYKAGTTTIRATVNGITYAIPVTVVPRLVTNNNYRTMDILIDSDDETKIYYNYSYGTDFIETHNGTRIFLRVPNSKKKYYYTNFFAAPDEDYALSYMSEWYAPIVEETSQEVRNGGGPYIFSTDQVQDTTSSGKATTISTAYNMGAEGMCGYDNSNNVEKTLKVRSERLPKITEKVYSINGNIFRNGDTAKAGDEVIFAVTVSKGAYEYVVNYDGTLTSNLSGAVFLGTSPTDTGTSTSQVVSISTTDSYSQTYYIKYTIPAGTTGNVTNTVTFNYESNGRESSTSSVGAVDSTASYKTDRTGNASATVEVGQIVQKSYITLGKEVAGNMRETDKYFKFLVDIQGTAGDEYTITGQDSTITYNGSQVTTSSTYTVGSTNYIYLKGGQTITIGIAANGTTTQVPVGVTYTITEQDAEEYITTIGGMQGETKTTGNLTIQETANTVEFLNSRDAAAMTGRFFEITEYAIIFAGSIIFILLIRRHRKRK